jgi:hypothetical protein
MTWNIHYLDETARPFEWRPLSARETALPQAADLMRRKCTVLDIAGPNGEVIFREAIEAFCRVQGYPRSH